jgi:hypothetical protein
VTETFRFAVAPHFGRLIKRAPVAGLVALFAFGQVRQLNGLANLHVATQIGLLMSGLFSSFA